MLKCICNENFDFVIFAFSENFIFSDHFNTNLVENFELKVRLEEEIYKLLSCDQ